MELFSLDLSLILPAIVATFFTIAIILSIVVKPSEFKKSRFYNFVQVVAPMSVLLMFTEGVDLDLTRKQ